MLYGDGGDEEIDHALNLTTRHGPIVHEHRSRLAGDCTCMAVRRRRATVYSRSMTEVVQRIVAAFSRSSSPLTYCQAMNPAAMGETFICQRKRIKGCRCPGASDPPRHRPDTVHLYVKDGWPDANSPMMGEGDPTSWMLHPSPSASMCLPFRSVRN